MNIATFIADKAKKRGKHPALFYKDISVNQWNSITWAELEVKVSTIARALVALDVEEQDNIGVISQNMPQGIITDFAAYANRAAVVPMFATLSPSQIDYTCCLYLPAQHPYFHYRCCFQMLFLLFAYFSTGHIP